MKKAIIDTVKGKMELEFYENDAPKTVENFINLSESGFYDGLTFHRVIPDFVIQVDASRNWSWWSRIRYRL